MKALLKLALLTAGSAMVYPVLPAVAVSALPVSKDQKNLNALLLKNERALAKARLERQEIASQLENERHQLEAMTANNLAFKKNQNLTRQQLAKLQQNLLRKKREQQQLESKYNMILAEEKKLEKAQMIWAMAHPNRNPLNGFLYDLMPPYAKDKNENILPLFFALMAQKAEDQKEALTSNTKRLEKENLRLKNQTKNLKEQQKNWLNKEDQIARKLEEAQKLADDHRKILLAHDTEIQKRKAVKAELEKKLADLISEEDLQQRIEQQKEKTQRKIQIQKGEKPTVPLPATAQKIQLNSGFAPLPSRPVAKWGEMEDGIANNSIKYRGHPNENVTAPVNALVLFAGNFAGFGEVIILDCGPKTRMVLSGLGKISVKKGDQIKKKQVIGQMPASATSILSLQLRVKNIPVNPAKYFKK